MKNIFFKNQNLKSVKGFILPFAILIATLILSISLGISTILVKEIFFSNLNRESSISYYAADVAMECALAMDDGFIGEEGRGIFAYNDEDISPSATATLLYVNSIRNTNFSSTTVYCAGVPIFNSDISNLVVEDCVNDSFCDVGSENYEGKNSIFDMRMDLGGNEFRCANVTVTKIPSGGRRIIARGYNTCNANNASLIERAVINVSESQ